MDLHLILAPGHAPEFATVEAESKRIARERGGAARPITLPDTKKEFVPFMNALFAETREVARLTQPRPDCLPREAFGRDMSAGAVISRCDNPGLDIDGIVETILAAKGCALKRYAGAVALAFSKLGGQ